LIAKFDDCERFSRDSLLVEQAMAIGNFLRILLQRLAAEQVKQTVADNLNAARQSAAAAPNEARQATEPTSSERELLPCHVGIVFALAMEAGYFEDRLAGLISIKGHGFTVRTGGLAGRGAAVITSGHGQNAAQKATEVLIAGHRPRWVISAGFAGGLRSHINRGDIVMASGIAGESGERLSIDLRMPDKESPQGVHVGRVLTTDRIIRTTKEKTLLGERHDALAVDMESLAVAKVCQQEKQRFLAIRAITDTVDDELPRDVERLLNRPTMVRKIGAAAGSLLRRPSTAKDLWRLRESAIVAASRLARFLEDVIKQLPD
jgi:adenosylhomocysteine nucleosidase